MSSSTASSPTAPELGAGRLFVLFQAQLRVDSHAPQAWRDHRDGEDWDHVVDHCMKGAAASQAARSARAGVEAPTVAWRHVTGGVAEATAAASQLLGKDVAHRVLVAYVGGTGQADAESELAQALGPAVTGQGRLVVFVGKWRARVGANHRWEKVFSAFIVVGPDVETEPQRSPHPVLDHLRPDLPTLTAE